MNNRLTRVKRSLESVNLSVSQVGSEMRIFPWSPEGRGSRRNAGEMAGGVVVKVT